MAWQNLDHLDYNKIYAVDARSELDLRIGAVFTRFQTLGLKNRFEELEDKKVISYGAFLTLNSKGSCQFPTLGFIVERYSKIKEFIAENFWKIDLAIAKDGNTVDFKWSRVHLFDKDAVRALFELCAENPTCMITAVSSKPTSKWAPLPLTTIELQKIGTKSLRMTSDRIMTVSSELLKIGR